MLLNCRLVIIASAALAGIVQAIAIDATKFAPEPAVGYVPHVIPGPGMPSLESLGLTDADLAKPYPGEPPGTTPVKREHEIFKRTQQCGYLYPCSLADAHSCQNYLHNLGHQNCVVHTYSQFCVAGGCQIVGHNTTPKSQVSSWCVDVATGMNWVFNHCSFGSGITGVNAANGNGDIDVFIVARND